ncbi:hypothetical protein [Halorientalis pallida]|uniref:Uncharacterized protein n=1 Tax=Halorientalis pallida TaxID=2479928 RepID=A0A498KXR6_9EURY|nr:hypothetical protein [Halorientalis pallida]RXK50038.1 hypothetical protein EAF64_05590 [Halorientalis pallida]
MDSELDFEEAFELERELRAVERALHDQRTELQTELTAAFRRANADTLHDADQRDYPLSRPEKRAVRRETAGPVRFLPEWEDAYRELADDQRTARERLTAFHRDVFTALAADAPYTVTAEPGGTSLDRPYLDVRARDGDGVVVLAVDNPVTEGYAYRTTDEYTEQDVENALRLHESLPDIDIERFGFVTHDTALVGDIDADTTEPERIRAHVRVEILEGLDAVDYEYVETDGSPILAFLETVDERGLDED